MLFSLQVSALENVFEFTRADKLFLKQFSLASLPALPPAPGNAVADDPRAAELGRQLFFDPRLSANGQISCSTCHQPQKYFTDGLPRSQALGTTRRSAPSILSAVWSPWLFWDGRKDSLWSQALGPIENRDEHDLSRVELADKIRRHHAREYRAVFGALPDARFFASLPASASPLGDAQSRQHWRSMPEEARAIVNRIFTNAGKALMAYQRRLRLPPSRFDKFVMGLSIREKSASDHSENHGSENKSSTHYQFESEPNAGDPNSPLTEAEIRGMRLFMGRANCVSCHNGPWFTNFEFHNIGAPEPDQTRVDMGRYEGVASLVADEFTCLSRWSDASLEECAEMRFLKRQGPELVGAFKTPTLRNIAATAPYMQSGQIPTLEAVLTHYNLPQPPFYDPAQQPNRPHFDILPLQLDEEEIGQIIAFLNTLTSPLPLDDPWWQSPH